MAYDGPLVGWASLAVLVAGVLGSVLTVVRLSGWSPLAEARKRLLLGLPLGTVLTVAGLNVVFWGLQGAADGPPVVVAFRSWSLLYPVGMVVAPFAHEGLGHITGNVLGTLLFAPVAEYAWSHYPTVRGSVSFDSAVTNPYVRVGLFLVGVVVVGLATSLLTPGALIGFSGVVFAFAGFALVTRPLLVVFAVLAQQVVGLVYFAVQNPVLTAVARPRVSAPSWAGVAVQGHALGLLVGALLGFWMVRRRDAWPDVRYVWFAVVTFAVSQTLYALYIPLSTSRFVLFRGLGAGAVFVLAALVATAMARSDRLVVARIDLWRREVAVGVLLAVVLALGLAAVPYNLADVGADGGGVPERTTGAVEVRDYTVTYVEGAPNGYLAAVDVPVVGRAVSVNESGVVVYSGQRNAWEVVTSKSELAFRGRTTVAVGGVGWRETVVVNRTSWSVTGGGTTYRVYARAPGEDREPVFASPPATAEPVINGTRVRIAPAPQPQAYRVALVDNGTVTASAPVPRQGLNRTLAGVTFNRTGSKLRAVYGGVTLTVARFSR